MTTTDSTEYRERVEFMSRLGFGDDKTEPAARLADIVDHIEYAFSQSSDHIDCPAWCELCGERLADKDCEPCGGSGCGPRTAEGAYDECEHCAGVGRIHEGCAGKTYAELAAENARLEGQLATARGLHKPERRYHGPDTDDRSFETPEEAAEYDDVPPSAVRHFDVCKTCGDLEVHDDEWRAFDWSLWPCAEAKALGLDGGGSDA